MSFAAPPPPASFLLTRHRMLKEWENQEFQRWLQVLGVILAFLVVMAILRFGINCLIDVAVLRDSESLMRQVSQFRRCFCPWWRPRTQPQQQQQQAEEIGRSPERSSARDEALDRVLAGLTPSEKREILANMLDSQIASEQDLLQWKKEKDGSVKDGSSDLEKDLELCRSTNDSLGDNNSSDVEKNHDISPGPTTPYTRTISQRSNPATTLVCPICIQDMEVGNPIISLASTCQHRFHSHCLVQWLSTHTRDCPYCRTEILTQDMLEQAYRQRQERQRLQQDRN